MIKIKIYLLCFLSFFVVYSQSSKKIYFENYETYIAEDNLLKQNGFYQSNIFDGVLTPDFWISENKTCIHAIQKNQFIEINWNKDQDQCDWVGLGFGWENWLGKDLSMINEIASLELVVRSVKGSTTNLPLAFGLEDYSGNQCWLGYQKQFLQDNEIDTTWTKVVIPLKQFPSVENDFSFNNVKQFIVQFFASGELQIQSIQLIPSLINFNNEISIKAINQQSIENNTIGYYNNDTLIVKMPSPENYTQSDSLVIDFAFSTNTKANFNRTTQLLSDKTKHIKIVDYQKNSITNDYNIKFNDNFISISISALWLDRKLTKGDRIQGQIILKQFKNGKMINEFYLINSVKNVSLLNPSTWAKINLD
jgi:hypothetical protein